MGNIMLTFPQLRAEDFRPWVMLVARQSLAISTSSATRIGTAMKTASGARKESADIKRAEETAAKVKADIEALNRELSKEVATLDSSFDAQAEDLDEVIIRAKSTDHPCAAGRACLDAISGRRERPSPTRVW